MMARLNIISASQNVFGTSTCQGTPTNPETFWMMRVRIVPSDTAATMRSRSGMLANRHVRSYRPSRMSDRVRTTSRRTTNGA